MWLTHYVITLANSTGWSEKFILEELPLSRGLQYIHAIICANGAKTVPTMENLRQQVGDIRASVKESIELWQQT